MLDGIDPRPSRFAPYGGLVIVFEVEDPTYYPKGRLSLPVELKGVKSHPVHGEPRVRGRGQSFCSFQLDEEVSSNHSTLTPEGRQLNSIDRVKCPIGYGSGTVIKLTFD